MIIFRHNHRWWVSPNIWLYRLVFWCGAMAIGLIAVYFARSCNYSVNFFFKIFEKSKWLPLIITPAVFSLGAFLTTKYFPGSQGSGIPQVIAAMNIRRKTQYPKLLSLRISVGKVLITMLGLCGGASIGREGPTVQVGASIMSFLGKYLKFSKLETMRSLILAGGAAGVAAAFNTPLAGIVFAIEELSRSFETKTNGIVLTTVVIAGIVSMSIAGNYTYFGHCEILIYDHQNWFFMIILCGVICGILGAAFNYAIVNSNIVLGKRLSTISKEKPIVFAAICGLLIAVIGLISGGLTFGTGYKEAYNLMQGDKLGNLGFGLYKFLATVVSYLSGIPGGIFAPSLSIGAGVGANIAEFFPNITSNVIVVMCMAGYFSGVVHSPITAAVIVMEMTSYQKVTIPLLAVSMIAYAVSRTFCKRSLYWALAEKYIIDNDIVAPEQN